MNPKIHRARVPMRTIICEIGTATEKLAKVAEVELDQFVVESPRYIRDITNFKSR